MKNEDLGERKFGRDETVPVAGKYRRFGRYDCTLGKLYARRRLYGVWMTSLQGADALGDGRACSK